MAYDLTAYYKNRSDVTEEGLIKALKEQFKNDSNVEIYTVDMHDTQSIIVKVDNFMFELSIVKHPQVPKQVAEDIADFGENYPDKEKLLDSKMTVFVNSDEDDDMDYFNDFVFIMEVLEKFKPVAMTDPVQGKFIDLETGEYIDYS